MFEFDAKFSTNESHHYNHYVRTFFDLMLNTKHIQIVEIITYIQGHSRESQK